LIGDNENSRPSTIVIPGPLLSHHKQEGDHMKLIHWIWAALTGFVVGLIARAILPGADRIGVIATTIVGILGSLVGGYIGALIKKPEEGAKFHPAGFLMSIVGAVILLLIWRMIG
jgi:uncharacterized membrane protein YeaQ/YmgE (transglycosylase-associated protein family)